MKHNQKRDRPSATAHLIARSVVFVARDPQFGYLVPPRAAEASVWFMKACSRRANLLLRLIRKKWFRALVTFVERHTIPGILLHYILRKRYLEDVARCSLQQSVSQVVILGAGFDTLALRLHQEFPTATFIEIDHPATQKIKQQVLKRRHQINHNLHLLPLDLSRCKLENNLLAGRQYRADVDTLFVAEGLLMYLEAGVVDAIFDFVAQHTGERSLFAFTFLEPQDNGQVNFRHSSKAIDLWLRLRGETFAWGIKRSELRAYLEARGFTPSAIATPESLRRRYLENEASAFKSRAEGDYICVAERCESNVGN